MPTAMFQASAATNPAGRYVTSAMGKDARMIPSQPAAESMTRRPVMQHAAHHGKNPA